MYFCFSTSVQYIYCMVHNLLTFLLPDLKQTAKTVKTTIYQTKTEQHTARSEHPIRVQL